MQKKAFDKNQQPFMIKTLTKVDMPFASTWMELEIFILSEVSQKEKDK